MKFFILNIFLLIFSFSAYPVQKNNGVLDRLKTEIAKKDGYDKVKLSRIRQLRSDISHRPDHLFDTYMKLFDEYEYYKFDSAYFYGRKILELSLTGKNEIRVNISKVKIASLLLHAGMFKETFDYLDEINVSRLDKSYKYDYYCLKSGAYSNLAIYNDDVNFTRTYNQTAIKYLDSAIAQCEPGSFDYRFTRGNRQVVAGQTDQPPRDFIELLKHYKLSQHQRARLLTGLAAFYQRDNQNRLRVWLLAESAISDIRSSTKETLATLLLAEDIFKHGDLDNAYLFIQQSRDDAGFYGNRLRKLKIESILPDIATQVNMATQREKNKFLTYFLSISLLAVVVSLTSFMIFFQLRRLKVKEQIIQQKNKELKDINRQLSEINDKLREYATVNERYIGYFFDVVSGYILKLDRLKKNVERKVLAKRFGEILPDLKDIDIKKERETLFHTFDRIFVSIFPNFVEEFNSLLGKEDQIWPKSPELLNTDLRIFALIRLGITDVEAIATILEYSINTVYVYKMRIKAKSLVSGEEFDRTIMSVKAV
ncbi:DUF6377 domain-containing protein [Pedobacter miscanthi]|uniref:Tetratricopeptide repeat protein n=1 Tax=Pedobacter miscanthi TaxID=2259170 RepID=A0A366KRC1_9SPHI|nr:DUF6377 domain-containing protein [Pedobacter miscanthi]RBQ03352.1 tetratricopeptide repeat protein [Pedobacter miscanthi]